MQLQDLKAAALAASSQVLDARIAAARAAMVRAQESANQEEKSSAGDKYETARAMGQIDHAMNARQLEKAQQDRQLLNTIALASHNTIQMGSLFWLGDRLFFMGAGLGALPVLGHTVVSISPASPIGRQLVGKTKGGTVELQGQILCVGDLC